MSLQTEWPTLKMIQLAERAIPGFSGNRADGEEIVTGTLPKISVDPKRPVRQIAEAAREAYANRKQRRAEENIPKSSFGAD